MTHIIQAWNQPPHIVALQTSRFFQQEQCFNIHPNQSTPPPTDALVAEFNLPHTPQFMQQVHKNTVIEYREPPKHQLSVKADACFTRVPGVICAVMTADCLPILMTDQSGTFVAAIHCGWRSLYANIIQKTIAAIKPQHEIMVWLGPCIQQSQYEVDESFVSNYLKQHPDSFEAFTATVNKKSQANLYIMAETQLKKLGIKSINKSNECTLLSRQYFSWRENATPHRMSTMAWIQHPKR